MNDIDTLYDHEVVKFNMCIPNNIDTLFDHELIKFKLFDKQPPSCHKFINSSINYINLTKQKVRLIHLK